MWKEGNVGVTPSRADSAGVPLSKMPPPLLAQILCLLIYQTGRCLPTFRGCHTHTQIVSLRPSRSFQKNGDHYCCRQQLFCVCTLSHNLLHFWLFCINLPFLRRVLTHLGTTLTSISSAYSTSFCETVTYITYISFRISSVAVGWNVCHVINIIREGIGGSIWEIWELVSRWRRG